jgi:hypothetical protein
MMAQAASTLEMSQRASLYATMAKYIASHAYGPFLVATAPVALTAKNAHGPGLDASIPVASVVINPYWDKVWMGKS